MIFVLMYNDTDSINIILYYYYQTEMYFILSTIGEFPIVPAHTSITATENKMVGMTLKLRFFKQIITVYND